MDSTTPLQFAHYEVRRREDGSPVELGRGAMGVTYKAFDPRLRVEVALKVINPAQIGDAKARALFLREARAAARIHQSNVAAVVYLHEDPTNPFYAMEFIAGESLRDWLHPRAPLEPLIAIALTLQIARGLEAIHRENVIHRDLKPANLMVVRADAKRKESDPASWQIKIIDFGLAKRLSMDVTETSAEAATLGFRGTALYASPEQCEERRDLDGRADLYSLGCVMWEMLVGAPPFRASVHRELLNAHVAKPPPLQQLSHLPECLQAVIARLMMKDRDLRYADAGNVIVALENCRERIGQGERAGTRPVVGAIAPEAPTTHLPQSELVSSKSNVHETERATQPRHLLVGGLAVAVLGAVVLIAAYLTGWGRGGPATGAIREKETPPPGIRPTTPAPEPATSSTAFVSPVTMTPATPPEKSIAVLPFENRSSDKENAYFCDGVQDEILTDLARIADLKVISRTSVMQYGSGVKRNLRDIARELGVTFVLEGSVQRVGGKVRVTAQLIDARTDGHVWAEHYDRDLADVFAIQSEIAGTIATQLKARLTPAEAAALAEPPTRDLVAYDLYLRAKQIDQSDFHRSEDQLRAVKLLQEAIVREPGFLLAYCFAARVLDNLSFDDHTEEGRHYARQAEEMVNEAVRLQPDAGETLLAQAHYYYYVHDDRKKAGEYLSRALVKLTNNSTGWSLLGLIDRAEGRWEEALRDQRRASVLDPTNLKAFPYITTLLLRKFDECEAVLDRMAALAKPPLRWQYELDRADLAFKRSGDNRPIRQTLEKIVRDTPAAEGNWNIQKFRWVLAESERDSAAMAAILERNSNPTDLSDRIWWAQRRILFNIFRGDRSGDRQACENLLPELEAVIAKDPGLARDVWAAEAQAWFYAALGRRDEAVRLGLQTLELNSLRRHAARGTTSIQNLAEVYCLLGETDRAIEQLEVLASIPSELNYGPLKLDLIWDPLRGTPRFQKLLEKMAPKDSQP